MTYRDRSVVLLSAIPVGTRRKCRYCDRSVTFSSFCVSAVSIAIGQAYPHVQLSISVGVPMFEFRYIGRVVRRMHEVPHLPNAAECRHIIKRFKFEIQ